MRLSSGYRFIDCRIIINSMDRALVLSFTIASVSYKSQLVQSQPERVKTYQNILINEMAEKIPNVILNNGQKMPIVGLGTWQAQPGEVGAAVKNAISLGYRHIDGAHVYQNEVEVGQAIRECIEEGLVKREDLFVVSKLWNTKHEPADVVSACRQTLQDLGLEYLDLYLIHWPMGFKAGSDLFPSEYSEVDYVETWKAMEECVKLGLTKSIGLSNFNSDQIFRILGKCSIKPVVNQVHPYLPQRMIHEFCQARGICVTGYSPLGSPNRPWAKPDDPVLLKEPKVLEIAKKYGKSPAQILLRWLVQRDIIAIPKSVNATRLKDNMKLFDFSIKEEDMRIIYSLERPGNEGRGCAFSGAKGHKYYPFHTEF